MRTDDPMFPKKLRELQAQSDKVREEATPRQKEVLREADQALEEIASDVFDFKSEDRVRKAGYTPQQAEDMAFMMKSQNIQVGQLFKFMGKDKVLTPFKTVVDAQQYVNVLQGRVLELTTVSAELETMALKETIREFTSLSFFGLITLAFKNLLKGKSNG